MDDQMDKNPDETGNDALDAAALHAGEDAGISETPEAVKAAGDGTDSAPTDDAVEAETIAEPSMNFPNAQVTDDEPETMMHPAPAVQAHPAEFPQFGEGTGTKVPRNINLLMDVKLPVSIELGRTTLPISEILEWGQGSIIELDRLAGEPVDLMVNNKLVAKGEVVVVDEKFGLRVTSLMSPRERLQTL